MLTREAFMKKKVTLHELSMYPSPHSYRYFIVNVKEIINKIG